MRNLLQNTAINLIANVFFGQKNFNFIEVGPYDHQLQEADLSVETDSEEIEREVFVPAGNLAFG